MIHIEKKKCDKIDWNKPLNKYITSQYSESSATQHNDALSNMQQLREDLRNTQDRSDQVKDLWFRYYSLLASVESRFPIREGDVKISFVWYDSFKGKKVSLYSVFYERACSLFNYSVLLSQLGEIQNRSTPDGIKLAAGYFQAAAGGFNELREYATKHPECSQSVDLNTDCLSMLTSLHLGQAQNCVIDKAVKDGMKDAIVAKLSGQAAEYYETTVGLLNGPLKNTIDRAWAANVEIWMYMHKASAQYRTALHAASSMKFGEQVARLLIADREMNEAKKRLTRNSPLDLKEIVDKLAATISAARTKAESDNDTAYHDTPPLEGQLAKIEPKALVKPTPLPDLNPYDPFSSLVPFQVKEAAGIYADMRNDLVRKEIANLEDHNEIAKATLSSLNLPGAIEAIDNPEGIPPALSTKMQTVSSENGPDMVNELMATQATLAKEDATMLQKAVEILDKEEADDNEMRQKYGERWARTPSHTLTPTYRIEASKYKGHLEHAAKSDAFVKQKWTDHSPAVHTLCGPSDSVLQSLSDGGKSSKQSSVDADALRKVLTSLDSLIASRENLKAELQQLSNNDEISMKLMAAQGLSYDQVYGEELRKYEPIRTKLRENLVQQESLLDSLRHEHESFIAKQNSDTAGQAARQRREHMLTTYSNAFNAYNEIKAGMREGIQFYTNLQEVLAKFNQKCNNFMTTRTTEKNELSAQLNSPFNMSPSTPSPACIFLGSTVHSYTSTPPTPPPGYVVAPPPYGAPPSAYGAPPPAYGAPPPYGVAPPPYGVAPSAYPPQQPPYGNAPN
eukprot:TRINITY_DN4104_c0_g2_i1.p1 TRINITY_DN4104_c0_g2~~TRINITY_DN4104_c0_g2_i1.p1  ORF type:complete len:792 (-),score=268.84 TRINITY_DN4104_c0_g2_i1:83-2458(-)